MFEIKLNAEDEIVLRGWFDASQVAKATEVFNNVNTSTIVNFKELEYISSAGLGVLLVTQNRHPVVRPPGRRAARRRRRGHHRRGS